MQKLLLTGFEPFGTWDTNPSWEIARALGGQSIEGVKVVAARLPVNWEGSWPALREAIEATGPRWVLMLGLAGNRSVISVESQGRNVCNDKPDNTERAADSPVIEVGGLDSLSCTLPVESMVSSIEALGVPVERSESAGAYLCNYTLYKALSWAAAEPQAPSIGFMHVPALHSADSTAPGIELADMVGATRAAITAIAESACVGA